MVRPWAGADKRTSDIIYDWVFTRITTTTVSRLCQACALILNSNTERKSSHIQTFLLHSPSPCWNGSAHTGHKTTKHTPTNKNNSISCQWLKCVMWEGACSDSIKKRSLKHDGHDSETDGHVKVSLNMIFNISNAKNGIHPGSSSVNVSAHIHSTLPRRHTLLRKLTMTFLRVFHL